MNNINTYDKNDKNDKNDNTEVKNDKPIATLGNKLPPEYDDPIDLYFTPFYISNADLKA